MCFTNFITLSGQCSDVAPQSGLTLNDININSDFINSIIERDSLDANAYVAQALDYSVKIVTNQIHGVFSDKYLKKTILSGERCGEPQDNLQLQAGIAGSYKGIRKQICNNTDYFQLSVSSISLQIDQTGSTNVLVYNLQTGLLIDTIPITTVANDISVAYVNKVYKSEKKELDVIFVYDSGGIQSNNTTLSGGGCRSCRQSYKPNNMVESTAISIPTASSQIDDNIVSGTETGGMSIVYSVECDHENWLCEKKNFLSHAILNRMGMVVMDKALDTERINQSTMIREQIVEKRDRFEIEFNNAMKFALENMDAPKGICFLCNRRQILNPVGI